MAGTNATRLTAEETRELFAPLIAEDLLEVDDAGYARPTEAAAAQGLSVHDVLRAMPGFAPVGDL